MQGQSYTAGGEYSVTWLKKWANTNYQVYAYYEEATNSTTTAISWHSCRDKTTTTCTIQGSSSTTFTRYFYGIGYAA